MKRTGLGIVMTIMCGVAALDVTSAMAESLEQRVERMERELRELKSELRRRDDAERRRAAEASRVQTAPPARAATPPPAVVAEAPPAEPGATTSTARNAALRGLVDRVQLGGYGSLRYEGSSLEEQRHTFTFRRFVLTADADIAPRLKSYMELEFERFRKLELERTVQRNDQGGLQVEQTVGGTADSEISFEQAWLQFDIDRWHQPCALLNHELRAFVIE